MQFGGVAALAGAAAALIGTSAAGAATTPGVMYYGTRNDAGPATTGLTSSNAKFGLHVKNSGLGNGIEAKRRTSTGAGLV